MTFNENIPIAHEGIEDIEIDLLQKPEGVLETYHAVVNTFADTIHHLQGAIESDGDKELLKSIFHKVIASTAEYGYMAGLNDGISKEKI